jgi:hypothetical protein
MCSKIFLPVIVGCLLIFSCQKKSNVPESPTGKLQGLHKYYYPDGELYLEVNFKDSIPHGSSKQYFKNGKLFEESEYVNGILHGISKKYYEDGTLSSEIPYDSGRVNGIQKKYRKDGTLAFEAPYYYGKPCVGLKEYYLSGDPVVDYPKIVITGKDEILKNDRYTLLISLSNKGKSVEYFRGNLVDGKYVDENSESIISVQGIGQINYFLPPGAFVMEKINLIAKIKTDLGNYYYAEKTYNVAVENR